MPENHKDRILIVSTCHIDWGGSEELWGRAADSLLENGNDVIVYKSRINRLHPEFKKLAAKGAMFEDWYSTFSTPRRAMKKIGRATNKIRKRVLPADIQKDHTSEAFVKMLRKHQPRLVIISQGINFDGLHHAFQCLSEKIPYVIVCQKAVDFYWPPTGERTFMTKALQQAKKCFFVSQHNQKLTEEQFGIRLSNGEVIYNPIKINQAIAFPSGNAGYKLACIARLFLLDKGQDILLRVLSKEKWKERPITVSFIGSGDDLQGLRAMADLLKIEKIEFVGQIDDIEKVWSEHHALVLPSRSEGLPLSLMEAMAAGRIVITTDAGGNTELLEEGVTGFVAYINETSLDEAMERAWKNRENWESMGKKAASSLRAIVPKNPEQVFINEIYKIINEQ